MNELIKDLLISVLTIAGAAIGAYLGAKAQIKATSISVFLPARLSAYSQFEAALKAMNGQITHETASAVYEAANMVVLVSSDKTRNALVELQDYIYLIEHGGRFELNKFQRLHMLLMKSMQADLRRYPEPKKEKV